MLKLATVFSRIGAIEHALDRMHIEHEIVFACDNGDVELELPKVGIDIDAMEKELQSLKNTIKRLAKRFAMRKPLIMLHSWTLW
jgi:DNA (cytosine-5)-methyltransferase 1